MRMDGTGEEASRMEDTHVSFPLRVHTPSRILVKYGKSQEFKANSPLGNVSIQFIAFAY